MRRIIFPSARALLAAAIAAYAAGFAALSVLRHEAYVTGRFDLGNMVQAVWSTAHGRPLQMTDLHGDQISRLAAHVDPILVVFAPLWWIWPSPHMLLVAQACAVALGAIPVFLLARKHLASSRAALGFGLAYLLYPATGWLTLNEFHPVALATPLLLFAFWYLDEDRLFPFSACALAAALCKEEIALVVAGFGIWYALARGRWVVGAAIAVVGAAWAAVAIAIVIPHYNAGAESDFYGRYSEVGGSAGGIVKTAFTHPLRIAEAAFSARDLHYLLDLVAPLAALCLLAPLMLVAALPELAINLLSSATTQTSIHFHYTAGLIPPLVIGAIFGAKRLSRWAFPVAAAIVVAALVGNYRLGPIPGWRHVPGGQKFQATAARVTAHDRIADRALRLIPDEAVVCATNTLGAHLSARRRVLSFPFIEDSKWVAADETQPGYADRYAPVPTATQLAALRRNPEWQLVFEQDGILVFRRRPL
ncbi:MAG: DUF2079 domain-containing protein [Actinobacteria bacterium]|nr:MAG: DUF2079 domain-containing protein [Actinomycetota bacterium]